MSTIQIQKEARRTVAAIETLRREYTMELLTDDGLKNEMRSLQRYLRYLVRKYQEVAHA